MVRDKLEILPVIITGGNMLFSVLFFFLQMKPSPCLKSHEQFEEPSLILFLPGSRCVSGDAVHPMAVSRPSARPLGWEVSLISLAELMDVPSSFSLLFFFFPPKRLQISEITLMMIGSRSSYVCAEILCICINHEKSRDNLTAALCRRPPR